jgi:hypothetical protein
MNETARVLMTPVGVQIWMKGKITQEPDPNCAICGKEIGLLPFYIPVAGVELPNPTERIHEDCMAHLDLLTMRINELIEEEVKEHGDHNEPHGAG